MLSKLFSMSKKDAIKTIIIVFLTALLSGMYSLFTSGNVVSIETIKPIVMAAIAYVMKQLLTNSDGNFLNKENGKI